MARIALLTAGTLGDHLPFVALARALEARGHRVRMILNPAMLGWAERCGIEAVTIGESARGPEEARRNAWAWDQRRGSIRASDHPRAQPRRFEDFYAQLQQVAEHLEGFDLLLATSIRPHGKLLHEVTGIPWITVSLNPASFWEPASEAHRRLVWRRLAEAGAGDRALLDWTLEALGRKRPTPSFRRGLFWSEHVILASSPVFYRPDLDQLQPHARIDQTGFWLHEDPRWHDWRPSDELERFCRRKPLVLSFSSQPLEEAGELLRKHVAAARRLQRPLLVQRGWADFSAEDLAGGNADDLLFIDEAPHDWLFARACCAIQHGGIGSLARALRQGCPVLVEPFGNDQFINAELVKALRFGDAIDPFGSTGEDIARTIFDRVLPPEVRQRAAEMGERLRGEDGLHDACCLIERGLERLQGGRDGRSRWWSGVRTLAAPLPAPPPLSPTVIRSSEPPVERQESIPLVLHQTFGERQIPEPYRSWRETWKTHHPEWRLRLWTDEDCRQLIARDDPWFLEIYDGYPDPRMRAEAARYFILHRHGGVYADLDYEALRPLEPLLRGRKLVLTSEPPAHLQWRRHDDVELISNAFLASVPGHPFWPQVFDALREWRQAPESFTATGPGLLTRVVNRFPGRVERPYGGSAGEASGRVDPPGEDPETPSDITVEASELLCPLSRLELEAPLPAETEEIVRRQAYAVHHWYGGWRLEGAAAVTEARVDLLFAGRQSPIPYRVTAEILTVDLSTSPLPLISCLMVTRDRPLLARRAIEAFKRQTYAEKELVIVDDSPGTRLSDWLDQHPHPRIRYFKRPDAGETLGALRNFSVRQARGEYLAQWDDDDLSAPPRLELQMGAIRHFRVDACLLQRQLVWRPGEMLVKSVRRLWEGSALVPKAMLPRYPELARGEDTPAIEELVDSARVAWLDMPELYLYVHHGKNTFGSDHWQHHFDLTTERYRGPRYRPMLRQVQTFFEVDLERIEDGSEERESEPTTSAGPQLPGRDERPTVLVLTLIRDGARHLPGHVRRLRETSYPNEKISLAFLEGDSVDDSHAELQALLPELRQTFARVELFKKDEGLRLEELTELERRAMLARRRNVLLQKALRDERWVLWMDAGLAAYPPTVIEHLLAVRKRIVVPSCLKSSREEPFDLSSFKLAPDAASLEREPHLHDGLLQPPPDVGRLYLTDLRRETLVELDGVGGSMLLIDADLHREGLVFPPFPYRGLIETEGLATMARDMGTGCWGMPNLLIYHA